MPSFPPIYLLRHGQTDWNAARRVQGQRESDLSDLGRTQAARQGEILRSAGLGVPPWQLYASPLRRTRQTAALALGPLVERVVFDDRLKEIGMGRWEGMLYSEVAATWPDYFASLGNPFAQCTGALEGEGFEAVHARAAAFLADLAAPSVIVAHGIVNAVLRGVLLGLDQTGMAALQAEQGVVLDIRDGVETVLR
ncbi:MAG: histidine phosphatase family protein [Rhodobacteraceae bacterium]|nr:histidine phosphatase family protein [Paracoccaceae bacterium]